MNAHVSDGYFDGLAAVSVIIVGWLQRQQPKQANGVAYGCRGAATRLCLPAAIRSV
jgi:hypothetical protein